MASCWHPTRLNLHQHNCCNLRLCRYITFPDSVASKLVSSIVLHTKLTHFLLPSYTLACLKFLHVITSTGRSQWSHGLRRRSMAPRLLRSWVRIPPGTWMSVCCECCVLSGRGLCDELITRPEESYRLWCVDVWDLEKNNPREWGWRPRPTEGLSRQEKRKTPQKCHLFVVRGQLNHVASTVTSYLLRPNFLRTLVSLHWVYPEIDRLLWLFIYGIFNDDVSSWNNAASNDGSVVN